MNMKYYVFGVRGLPGYTVVRSFPASMYVETIYPNEEESQLPPDEERFYHSPRARALPEFGDYGYLARAESLGYGNGDEALARMNVDHEVLHTLYGRELLGLLHSPILWAVSQDALDTLTEEQKVDEESHILAIQAFGNGQPLHHPTRNLLISRGWDPNDFRRYADGIIEKLF